MATGQGTWSVQNDSATDTGCVLRVCLAEVCEGIGEKIPEKACSIQQRIYLVVDLSDPWGASFPGPDLGSRGDLEGEWGEVSVLPHISGCFYNLLPPTTMKLFTEKSTPNS